MMDENDGKIFWVRASQSKETWYEKKGKKKLNTR